MPSASSQFIFVYGTLRSDQPEHARFCPDPLSICNASVSGSLFEYRGYPILRLPGSSIIANATEDPVEDWQKWAAKEPAITDESRELIEGELIEFDPEDETLTLMDQWEGFEPGSPKTYGRFLVPVRLESSKWRVAWTYGTTNPPAAAVPLNIKKWVRPEDLQAP